MQIGKERCERKAYPHKVYPDRNRIRLRVNGALVGAAHDFNSQFLNLFGFSISVSFFFV